MKRKSKRQKNNDKKLTKFTKIIEKYSKNRQIMKKIG